MNKMQLRRRVGAASAVFGEGLQALLVSWRLVDDGKEGIMLTLRFWSLSQQCRVKKAKLPEKYRVRSV